MSKVTINAKAKSDDKKLTVFCSIANAMGHKIYLFWTLWTVNEEGKTVPESQPAYVSLGERNELYLGKIVHPLPKDAKVEQRIVPFAKALDAGKTWSDDLEFALPIPELNPYYIAEDGATWKEVAVGSVRVCVDWISHSEALKVHPAPIEGSFRLEHPRLLKSIERSTSDVVSVKAIALRRTDAFERFACEPVRQ